MKRVHDYYWLMGPLTILFAAFLIGGLLYTAFSVHTQDFEPGEVVRHTLGRDVTIRRRLPLSNGMWSVQYINDHGEIIMVNCYHHELEKK